MSDNVQLHPSIRALMMERRKRAKRFRESGVEYSALLKYRCTADEDKAIDDLIIEAARCRVNYFRRADDGWDTKFLTAARASRIHMLRLIMSNYDECGTEEMWERDPHALASLIREFQLYLAHAIIGTPEVVYRFGGTDEDYTPLTDADKRLDEYAREHGWLAVIVDGDELGNADYTVRDAAMLGVTEDSDDETIRALYDAFIRRLYACIASDNFLIYRPKPDNRRLDHIDEYTENKLWLGFECKEEYNTDYDTCGDIKYLLISELGDQIWETRSDETSTRTATIEGLGEALEKATDFYALMACDAALGYTILGRETYMSMIDELLNDVWIAEHPEL